MRKIALFLSLLLFGAFAHGQTYARYQNCQLQTSLGQAVAGASVYFLTQPANTSNLTPLASVYSSPTGGAVTQPLMTDGHGQCAAYLIPGTYTVVYVSPFTGSLVYPDQTVSFGAIGTISPISQIQWPLASGTSLPSICPGSVTGNLISGSNVISSLSSTANIYVGQLIIGTGIPASTYISTVNTATSSITISNNATTTQNTVSLSFYSIGQPFQNTASNTEQFCTASGWSNGFPSGVVPVGNGGTGASVAPTLGQILIGNSGGTAYSPQTLSGDCTITDLGVLGCTPLVHTAGTEIITGSKTFNNTIHTSGTIGIDNGAGQPPLFPGTIPIGNQGVSSNQLNSGNLPISALTLNGIIMADQFPGSDMCAKIISAETTASGKIIDATHFQGIQSCASDPLTNLQTNQTLLLGQVRVNSSVSWNISNDGVTVRGWGFGNTIVNYSGSVTTNFISSNGPNGGRFGVTIADLAIIAQNNVTHGLYIRTTHHSTFYGLGCWGATYCFWTQASILNTWIKPTVSIADAQHEWGYATPSSFAPTEGIHFDIESVSGVGVIQTTTHTVIDPNIENVTGCGINLASAASNVITAGTSEGNQRGICTGAASVYNTVIGIDLESNTTQDVLEGGTSDKYFNIIAISNSTNAVELQTSSQGTVVDGGNLSKVLVDTNAQPSLIFAAPRIFSSTSNQVLSGPVIMYGSCNLSSGSCTSNYPRTFLASPTCTIAPHFDGSVVGTSNPTIWIFSKSASAITFAASTTISTGSVEWTCTGQLSSAY